MSVIEYLSNNPNRTFGDVCQAFTKTKISTECSVRHSFDHLAILVFKHNDEEAVLEALMETGVGVTDMETEDGKLSVFAPHTDYFKAKQAPI